MTPHGCAAEAPAPTYLVVAPVEERADLVDPLLAAVARHPGLLHSLYTHPHKTQRSVSRQGLGLLGGWGSPQG